MTRRLSLILSTAAVLLVVIALVGVGGLLFARPATAQNSVGVNDMRQVTVVGHGEVIAQPDTATVQIGSDTEATTAKDALAKNTEQTQAFLAKLKELGVAEKDMQTSNFSIYPTYSDDGHQITGYHVSNSVTVTIHDLSKAGELLDQVVQAGANSIGGISFSVADTDALLAKAREQALQDARTRAEQLAKAGGATVGDLLVITENVGSAPIPLTRSLVANSAESKAVPVQAGEQSYSADVQVTFQLR